MKGSNMVTARFWFYWNGTDTLLKLKDNESLTLRKCTRWSKGYCWRVVTISRKRGRLVLDDYTDFRDCDGACEDQDRLTQQAIVGLCPHPDWRALGRDTHIEHNEIAAGY